MSINVIEAGSAADRETKATAVPAHPSQPGLPKPTGRPIDLLSPRELDVFRLLAEGLSTEEAGEKLGIAKKTVEWHRERLGNKLGIRNRGELTRVAVEEGAVKIRFRRKDAIVVGADGVIG